MSKKINASIIMLLSTFSYSIVQTLVKFLGSDVSPWAKAFYRSSIGLIVLVFWLFYIHRQKIHLHNIPILLLRGIVGGLSLAFSFWAIELIDLSRATLYLYTAPIFAQFFSFVFFHEKLNKWFIIPLLISIWGVYLIITPSGYSFTYKDLIGLLSGLFSGLATSSVRELRKTDRPENIYLVFCIIASFICLAGVVFNPNERLYFPLTDHHSFLIVLISLIFIGLFSTIGQLLIARAYIYIPITVGSVISLLTLPIVTVIAVIVFKEVFTWSFVFGAIMIFCSAVIVSLLDEEKIHQAHSKNIHYIKQKNTKFFI